MSIESVIPSSHLILCRPLFLLPPIPPSNKVFSNDSTHCMRWSKYWSFSFSISPSNEHPYIYIFKNFITFLMQYFSALHITGLRSNPSSADIQGFLQSDSGLYLKRYLATFLQPGWSSSNNIPYLCSCRLSTQYRFSYPFRISYLQRSYG